MGREKVQTGSVLAIDIGGGRWAHARVFRMGGIGVYAKIAKTKEWKKPKNRIFAINVYLYESIVQHGLDVVGQDSMGVESADDWIMPTYLGRLNPANPEHTVLMYDRGILGTQEKGSEMAGREAFGWWGLEQLVDRINKNSIGQRSLWEVPPSPSDYLDYTKPKDIKRVKPFTF